MAVSVHSTSAFGTVDNLTNTIEVPAPAGTPASGDRVYAWIFCKFTGVPNMACADNGGVHAWNEALEFADGSTVSGNGTGSVHIGCFWSNFEAIQNTADITVTMTGGSSSPGAAITQVLRKGGSETWDTPQTDREGFASGTNQFVSTGNGIGFTSKDGAILVGLAADCDNDAFSAEVLNDSSLTQVFNGTTVNDGRMVSATGNDIGASLNHRLITTGDASTWTASYQFTLAAAASGTVMYLLQDVTAAGGVTVTPGVASLTLTTFAPTVTATGGAEFLPYRNAMVQLLSH